MVVLDERDFLLLDFYDPSRHLGTHCLDRDLMTEPPVIRRKDRWASIAPVPIHRRTMAASR